MEIFVDFYLFSGLDVSRVFRNVFCESGKGRGAMLGYCEASFRIEELFIIILLGGFVVFIYCL